MVNLQSPSAYELAGGDFLCRRNQLLGWILMAFGLGLLIGVCIEGGFFSCCVAIGASVAGFLLAARN